MIENADGLIAKIEAGGGAIRRNGTGWQASCSVHQDPNPSVSINEGEEGKILLKCHGCGAGYEQLLAGYGIDPKEMPGAGVGAGVTLDAYAKYVGLAPEFLTERFDLQNSKRHGKPSVRLPYRDVEDQPAGHRVRASLRGNPRLTEPKRVETPYGAWRLPEIVRTEVILVEGESDTQVGWHVGLPTIGIPGANRWRSEWSELLRDFQRILVWREPGEGGRTFVKSLANDFGDRLLVIDSPAGTKDLRELWLGCAGDCDEMRHRWERLRASARPWRDLEAERIEDERTRAWPAAEQLAREPRILDRVSETASRLGLAGEETAVKLAYLVFISALTDEPLAAVLRATAAAGKSKILKTASRLVPDDAVITMTAMSPRALAYTDEDLRHRTLLLIEADAIAGEEHETAALMLRTLVSEHVIEYRTVAEGREVHRRVDGPLALLTTTTRATLEKQLETRILAIPADDSREQTKAVIVAAFAAEALEEVDLAPFHALYHWLEAGARSASIPFGATLAELIRPVAVRLRRDARQLRDLVADHAILHQATRQRDSRGRVVATIDDYAAVRDLVAQPMAEGAGAAVHPSVRTLVELVASAAGHDGVTLREIGERLGIGTEAARSRVRRAGPFLRNIEDRRGVPGRYVVGEAMPTGGDVLPSVEELISAVNSEEAPRTTDRADRPSQNPTATGLSGSVMTNDRSTTHPNPGETPVKPNDRTQNPADIDDLAGSVSPVTDCDSGPRTTTQNGALPLDAEGQIRGQLSFEARAQRASPEEARVGSCAVVPLEIAPCSCGRRSQEWRLRAQAVDATYRRVSGKPYHEAVLSSAGRDGASGVITTGPASGWVYEATPLDHGHAWQCVLCHPPAAGLAVEHRAVSDACGNG